MTFKLGDELSPVARFNALQRAKEWQEKSSGNSSGLVAQSPPFQYTPRHGQIPYPAGTGGFMDEIPRIITPEAGVFSTAGGNISDSQFNAWQNESELARRALGLKGDMHRENMKEKWYSEYLAKGDEGGGWEDILSGALSGASAGASFGPWGALAGAGVGGITSAIG